MDKHSYVSLIEKNFQKSEYITIGHKSFKMLWSPKNYKGDAKLFCFVLGDENASDSLFDSLCSYAKSIAFYDDPQNRSKIYVTAIFVTDNFVRLEKGQKFGGVYFLPASFDLENGELKLADKFPLLSKGAFSELYDFSKKCFKI